MRIEAHHPHLSVLFEEIARQIFRQIIDPELVGSALREKIGVEGESLDHLLREWVTALIELTRTQRMVFSQLTVLQLKIAEKGPYIVLGEGVGELLDPHRHVINPLVPKITCRQASFYKDVKGYHADILLGP